MSFERIEAVTAISVLKRQASLYWLSYNVHILQSAIDMERKAIPLQQQKSNKPSFQQSNNGRVWNAYGIQS